MAIFIFWNWLAKDRNFKNMYRHFLTVLKRLFLIPAEIIIKGWKAASEQIVKKNSLTSYF